MTESESIESHQTAEGIDAAAAWETYVELPADLSLLGFLGRLSLVFVAALAIFAAVLGAFVYGGTAIATYADLGTTETLLLGMVLGLALWALNDLLGPF